METLHHQLYQRVPLAQLLGHLLDVAHATLDFRTSHDHSWIVGIHEIGGNWQREDLDDSEEGEVAKGEHVDRCIVFGILFEYFLGHVCQRSRGLSKVRVKKLHYRKQGGGGGGGAHFSRQSPSPESW